MTLATLGIVFVIALLQKTELLPFQRYTKCMFWTFLSKLEQEFCKRQPGRSLIWAQWPAIEIMEKFHFATSQRTVIVAWKVVPVRIATFQSYSFLNPAHNWYSFQNDCLTSIACPSWRTRSWVSGKLSIYSDKPGSRCSIENLYDISKYWNCELILSYQGFWSRPQIRVSRNSHTFGLPKL